jgi:hypothetical protein
MGAPHHFVHLVEQGVFAQIGEEGDAINSAPWVVDTGSTNHMTGARTAFSVLDTSVCETVRFDDGSVVRIEGCDMITFECKNGEHLSFSDIYYIPSSRQASGSMCIRDAERRLLTRIPQAMNRLFLLDVDITQLVYFLAHAKEEAWRWHAWLWHLSF